MGLVGVGVGVNLQEEILTFFPFFFSTDDGDNPHLVMTPRAIASD